METRRLRDIEVSPIGMGCMGFSHALPDTYVASDIERVEVVRGPGSLLYGSNAMGGVVNIITRQHLEQGRRTQARVMYGSYNTQKYMINNGYNIGKFSSFLSVNHVRVGGMINITFLPNKQDKYEFKNIVNQLGWSRYTTRSGVLFNSGEYVQEQQEYFYNSRTTYNGQFTGLYNRTHVD